MPINYTKFYFEKDGDIWEKIVHDKNSAEILGIIRNAVMVEGYKLIKWEEWISEKKI
ncbi:hypothetical protein [Methanococcus vannielii]|uniref:hypothetical protein n=1 Tax=Methanococcus vannielii TaxID=2187 RepID=UPI000AFB5CF3|nr:hypothetical protein [Methanococcus vannielii]